MKSAFLWLLPALCLTACGGADQPTEKPTAPPAAAPTAPAAQATPAAPGADTTAVLNALVRARFPQLKVAGFKAGDINADGRPDMIVVAEQACDDEDGMDGAQCRTALLVVNEGYPKLRIAATNDNVVDCSTCGGAGVGDPHQQIVIKGNYFSFESLYGACDKTAGYITFRYDKARNDWFLHRLSREDYSCNDTTDMGDIATHATHQTTKDFGRVSFAGYNLQVI